jgi:hypothetical protein
VLSCTTPYQFQNTPQCVSTCSFGYQVVGSVLQCVSACAWPSALYIDTTYSATLLRCAASCPSSTFLNRATQSCISSCGYLNASLLNGNQICETPGNATNCPFLQQVQVSDTFLTCEASCPTADLVFTNGSFQQCVTSCPAAA